MSSQELYYQFSLILNKNYSQKNISYDKGNFVKIFNRELLLWLDEYIDKNNSNSNIKNIQGLITVDEKLNLETKGDRYNTYSLPSKFFDFINSYATCTKGKCTLDIPAFTEKPKLIQESLVNVIPSFDFEETLCNIAGEKVLIYLGDFEIKDAYLSYYHTPQKIDIEGYRNIDGTYSKNIDSNLDELLQHQVINRTVIEVMRQFENGGGFNLSSTRPQG